MNMPINTSAKSRTHPMLIIASAAVVLFCITATAAVVGWIPSSMGRSADSDSLALASPAAREQPAAVKAPPLRVASSQVAQSHRSEPVHRVTAPVCRNCGVVESIREISTRGDGSGLGAAGGAVVGGLLGNQVGGGHGKDAMTVVGAIGGAFAGNQIEKQVKATRSYETTIRMNDGASRSIAQATQPEWRNGDHVKIVDGVVRFNG